MSKSERFSFIALIAGAKVRAFRRVSHLNQAQQLRVARRLCRS